MSNDPPVIKWLADLGSNDVSLVGGKNASLGEMIQHLHQAGISVPDGFATTAQAYWDFIETNELKEKITEHLAQLSHQERPLNEIGDLMRSAMRFDVCFWNRNSPMLPLKPLKTLIASLPKRPDAKIRT